MKFLVDESTGIGVSKKLKLMGLGSVSVIDCMKGAEDEEIMKRAVEEDRVIITNDKDFGRLAGFYKPPGVILLRLRGALSIFSILKGSSIAVIHIISK